MILKINTISTQFNYIQGKNGWKKIFYAHQDDKIMDNIQILFSEANKNQKELMNRIISQKVLAFCLNCKVN